MPGAPPEWRMGQHNVSSADATVGQSVDLEVLEKVSVLRLRSRNTADNDGLGDVPLQLPLQRWTDGFLGPM